MRTAVLFLTLVCLLAGCGGGNENVANAQDALREKAKPAEENLTRVRDAVVKYHKEKGEVPRSVTHLGEVGLKEASLANEDYSELGYAFYNIAFDDQGKLVQGWLIATPMADRDALQVRMNAVTGEFDYVGKGEDFGTAPSDNGPINKPASNG